MKITIFTLFPHWFDGPLGDSVIGRAREKGLLNLETVNFRDNTTDRHQSVDDAPYGGGGGMVLRADILAKSMDDTIGPPGTPGRPRVLYMSPRGRTFDQSMAEELAGYDSLAILCGHYETADQRLIDSRIDEEVSLGDFVLTGGELPAMMIVDAVTRLLDGALGNDNSAHEDSFSPGCLGLLEGPHYTRPEVFEGTPVPEVLLSGNHGAIAKWREEKSLDITRQRRPDLLNQLLFEPDDLRRIGRRARPFLLLEQTSEPGVYTLLYATERAALHIPQDTPITRQFLKGCSKMKRTLVGTYWAEVKAAFHDDPEKDREALLEEMTALATGRRKALGFTSKNAKHLLAALQE